MSRTPAVMIAFCAATAVLSGCGASSPYCQAIDDHRDLLSSFDEDRTDKTYAAYADALAAIAAEAPEAVAEDWKAVADATQAVVAVHTDVGFKIEDMDDRTKREGLSAGDIETINDTYTAFNGTLDQRKAAVADADKTCDITLK